jgi:uncharacterized protein (TIGR00369 family)
MEPIHVEHGSAVLAYMPVAAASSGELASVLDEAMGYAVSSLLALGDTFSTSELRTSYRRPVTVEAGPLRVEAGVLHRSSTTALAEARIVDAEGRLFAHATATWSVRAAA